MIGPQRGTQETGRKPPTISGFELASECHDLTHDNRNLTVANDFIQIGVQTTVFTPHPRKYPADLPDLVRINSYARRPKYST
ncbi:MAG: hypothetical protein VX111_14515, partial [Planctomycetota bacterium]|nr:hypothetical protein [Planctomycetota bacterium]